MVTNSPNSRVSVQMPASQTHLDAVIRFPEVTISREVFEAALLFRLDRFEPSRNGLGHYAQVDMPEGSSWDHLVELLNRIRPMVEPYLQRSEIGRPWVDAALYVDEDKASASLLIPSEAAFAIGRSCFDLEISVYLTGPD